MRGLTDMGFTSPTPIQKQAIPLALAGRDVIGCASTGTGKTAAFLLPTLQRLFPGERGKIRALVLSPTRELAMQIDEQALALGYHVKLTAVSVVGGVAFPPQEHALRAGAEIVVATPGRLLDHMRFGYVDFANVEVLVLDEADRMLDMGFLPDIKRILEKLPKKRQTLFFSATMPPPIRKLADDILVDPAVVTVDPQKSAAGITHSLFRVSEARKAALLTQLIDRVHMPSVLVFVKRKSDANKLARVITRAVADATSIHSDRTQAERIQALADFRSGRCPVLVATDVMARGIDVDDVSHVVNYDVPHSAEDFIHRGGRTARAGAIGSVYTFVSPREASQMREIETELKMKIREMNLKGFDAGLDERAPRSEPEGRRRR
jgi:ATP-dependent RNA helicase RhlE